MPLTRDRVVEQALDLLQEVGLDGLTLRRLADRLGVSAPTLYWHVRDKRQLLDLMAEQIIGRSARSARLPEAGQAWDAWLRERALALRTALLAHRDSARVVAGNRPTVASLAGLEAQLEALVGAGFRPDEAMLALLSIGQYVTGHVLDEQLAAGREPDPTDPVVVAMMSGDFPVLAQAVRSGLFDPEGRFESGLATILAGLQARLQERTAPQKG